MNLVVLTPERRREEEKEKERKKTEYWVFLEYSGTWGRQLDRDSENTSQMKHVLMSSGNQRKTFGALLTVRHSISIFTSVDYDGAMETQRKGDSEGWEGHLAEVTAW